MYTNKLIGEKSPYLLQHAHNPVDWHPWGAEAFDKARREQKPVFLSVGYSTCHWCHVMERESFESAEVAGLLNRNFVSVKVDREERPDIDRIYMAFVQATTGGGGWPMSVWLTPDGKPFFGGTYFPPVSAYGRPGFPQVLEKIAEAWANDPDRIVSSSKNIEERLSKAVRAPADSGVSADSATLEAAFHTFRRMFDDRHAGFGSAPKFPRPVVYNFLLRYHARTGSAEPLEMVLKTLRAMAEGGMRDQIGGGFHRYSVDERWFVPHFEKMLYDQAQLAVSYLEAFQITGDNYFADVARDTLEYVLRDMTSPEGAFFSAEDADSVIDPASPHHKGEGAFYIWSREEIEDLLDEQTARWFCHRWGVEQGGNVKHDPQGEFTGRNILYQAYSVEETAHEFGVSAEQGSATLDEARRTLLTARSRRVRPHLDDKVLASWNGLMISAFAIASQVLGESRYLDAARRAADFILTRMYDASTGSLLRRHRDGEAAIPGFLDDYAAMILGLLDLYESCFDVRYLDAATRLAERELELFEDTVNGGFFTTADGDPTLLLRMKDDYDGAEPSGNSMAVLGLLRLAQFTDRSEFRKSADSALDSFSRALSSMPVAAPQMLVALDYALAKPRQIVFAGDPSAFLVELRKRFLPNRVVMLAGEELGGRLPVVANMKPVDGKPAVYVCENYSCRLPITDPSEFAALFARP